MADTTPSDPSASAQILANEMLKTARNELHAVEDVSVARALIDLGADVNTQTGGKFSSSPLHSACERGRLEIAKLLVDRGASLAATNYDGMAPLHVACFSNRPEVVAFLLRADPDPPIHVADGYGITAFQRAARFPRVAALFDPLNKLTVEECAKNRAALEPLLAQLKWSLGNLTEAHGLSVDDAPKWTKVTARECANMSAALAAFASTQE